MAKFHSTPGAWEAIVPGSTVTFKHSSILLTGVAILKDQFGRWIVDTHQGDKLAHPGNIFRTTAPDTWGEHVALCRSLG